MAVLVFLVFRCQTASVALDELLSTGQVARLLGCSRQHVVDLCTLGALPYVSVGTHRRIRRSDVERLAGGTLRRDQERSLWLHRVVSGRLAMETAPVMEAAAKNLRPLREVHPEGMTARWLDRWEEILRAGPDAVFEALTSRAEWAVELRQNSPFAGVLTPAERQAALDSFRGHWRRAHAA
jgi:excisionase family DNA binding protein